MCGITGYIGEKDAYPIIINGLKRLEYRGYDSAGIMIYDGEDINLSKTKGKVSDLEQITDYISELLAGNTDNLPALGVRVFNPTDLPVSSVDTVVRNYNWNPKAITLLNNNTQNTSRKPKLKISYSLKTEEE